MGGRGRKREGGRKKKPLMPRYIRKMVPAGRGGWLVVQRSINMKERCLMEFDFLCYDQNTIFEGAYKRKAAGERSVWSRAMKKVRR